MTDLNNELIETTDEENIAEENKTKCIKTYMKDYYKKNKDKYLDNQRKLRSKKKTPKEYKYRLIIVSESGSTLFICRFYSQQEIADKLGIPLYTIHRILKNKYSYNKKKNTNDILKHYKIEKL